MIQPIIEKAVIDINEIVILSYQFIRLYLLDKFNNKQPLPTVNKQFVTDVIKTVSSSNTKAGQKIKEENIKNATGKLDIKRFYKDVFYGLVSGNNNTYKKPSYTNKTFIIEQTTKEMITCIQTNISTHFIEHLFKYINCLFKYPRTIEIKKEKDKEKRKEMYKELNQEIRNLKNDVINNKIECSNKKYHKWIMETKRYLYPSKINKSVAYDVKNKPERYIQYSFFINQKIEEMGKIPTPNIGLKKLLASRFEIIEVNEYNTSKLYNKTLKELENVYVKVKKGKHKRKKHLHEILTPKEETECRIFVNRDKNACKNILLLGKCYLTNQTRLEEFTRKVIKKEPIKPIKKKQNKKLVSSSSK